MKIDAEIRCYGINTYYIVVWFDWFDHIFGYFHIIEIITMFDSVAMHRYETQ